MKLPTEDNFLKLAAGAAALPGAGLSRAKAHSTRSGNPIGRPKVEAAKTAIRMVLVKGDRGMCKIAAELCVGVGTVQRVAAELKAIQSS